MSQAQGLIELAAVPLNKLSKKAVYQIPATLLYNFVVVGEYLQTLLIPSAATMCHEWAYSWKTVEDYAASWGLFGKGWWRSLCTCITDQMLESY